MGDFKRNNNGTPYVADPHRRTRSGAPSMVLYSRPSGFVKQIENTYNLQKWSERKVVAGIAHALHDPLGAQAVEALLEAITRPQDIDLVDTHADTVIAKAKEYARSSLAADRGTWVHRLTEMLDEAPGIPGPHAAAGVELGFHPQVQGAIGNAWRRLLVEHHLEVIAVELPVVNDEFRTAGTLDRLVRLGATLRFATGDGDIVDIPAGTVMVLDLKTGEARSFNWWNAYASQVYLYASSVGYDTERNARYQLDWPVDTRWGLIAHLDAKAAIDGVADFARILLVDLDTGRHACELAAAAKEWASRDGVFSLLHQVVAPAADLPPAAVERPAAGSPARPGGHLTPSQQKSLVPAPDDGPNTRSGKDWVDLQSRYETLPDTGKELLRELMRESTQAGRSWHRKTGETDRKYHLYDAAVTLAEQHYDLDWSCEVMRALMAHVVDADWPLFPSVTTGHVFGSLTADEASRLAAAVRRLADGGFTADLTRDVLELKPAA